MRPLLSEISFVMVTDLLPKRAIKTPHEWISHAKKIFALSIHLSSFVLFPRLNEFLE